MTITPQQLAKIKRTLRREMCVDRADPHDDVSVGLLFETLPDGRSRLLETWHLRTTRTRRSADLTARLRDSFPRLSPAQIAQIARVVRRKRGRPITQRSWGRVRNWVRGAK